jgi:hypothetical protein
MNDVMWLLSAGSLLMIYLRLNAGSSKSFMIPTGKSFFGLITSCFISLFVVNKNQMISNR